MAMLPRILTAVNQGGRVEEGPPPDAPGGGREGWGIHFHRIRNGQAQGAAGQIYVQVQRNIQAQA